MTPKPRNNRKKDVPRAGETVNGMKLLPGTGAPGPGRPKGSKDTTPRSVPATRERAQNILAKILTEGPTPLEVMYKLIKKTGKLSAIDQEKMEIAVKMAPYVHPKLASIELKGRLGETHEEALARLEKMEHDNAEEPVDVPYEIVEESA